METVWAHRKENGSTEKRSSMEKPRKPAQRGMNEKGMVLVVTLMLMSVLVVLGTTAIMTVSTDIKIAGNYRQNQVALYNAEAGVEQVITSLRTGPTFSFPTVNATQAIVNGGSCPTSQCAPITLSVPTGFSFSNTVNIYGYDVANKKYVFRITGNGGNNAAKTIEIYIDRQSSVPDNVDGAVAMYGGGPQVALPPGANPHENYIIDGQDYPVPADANCNGSACDTAADTTKPALPGLYTVMAPSITGTLSYLNGNPDQTIGVSHEPEWNAFVDKVLADTNLYQSTMGTRAAPAVTVIGNGETLSGTYNGAGIIIVDDGGELQLTGNGCFEGIIILRGSGTVRGTGTNNVYGSIITIGHESKLISATGAVKMFYSSAAIANLGNINALTTTQKKAWRDVK